MNVVIITDDKMISVDGEQQIFDFEIDQNIWAVKWDGTSGEVEYVDNTPNLHITDFSDYRYLLDAWANNKQAIFDEKVAEVVDISSLRRLRDALLSACDWRLLPDYPFDDLPLWVSYRQALRDLPNGYVATSTPQFPKKPGTL
jgi:hypothetical protein